MSGNLRSRQTRAGSRLEVRLLGPQPHALIDGVPITLEPRSWKLVILMLLAPELSYAEMCKYLVFEGSDPAADEQARRREVYRAKSDLLRRFREHEADDRLEAGYGFLRFTAQPDVDYTAIPWNDEAKAFDYCVRRGDLLRDFKGMDLVREQREQYHQKLLTITTSLVAKQTTDAAVKDLLSRAGKVLPRDHVQALQQEQRSFIEVTTNQDIEASLRVIEWRVKSGETTLADVTRLDEVVRELEQAAQHWRPTAHGQVERAATLVHVFESTDLLDLDDIYVKVANTYYLGHDLLRAVEFIRPWLNAGKASANAFCTAALYNLGIGYIAAARACFERAYDDAPSADFKLTVGEKRDIQLRVLQGTKEPRRFTDAWRSAINNPAYHDMSPGSRASVWCNLAGAAGSAADALRLAQKGREIDKDTENPHYEFDLLRYARAAGEKRLAGEYEGQVKELMSVPRPPGFRLSYLSLQADQLTTQISPKKRDLGEADTLWNSIYHDARLTGNIPQMCRVLLRRADLAKRLREFGRAYEYATTAYLLSGERSQGRLRYAAKAGELREELESRLDYKARGNHGANGQAVAQQVSRPHPLVVPQGLR